VNYQDAVKKMGGLWGMYPEYSHRKPAIKGWEEGRGDRSDAKKAGGKAEQLAGLLGFPPFGGKTFERQRGKPWHWEKR